MVIDGASGEVLVDPTQAEREDFRVRSARPVIVAEPPRADLPPAPSVTLDGLEVRLEANLELPEDVAQARGYGAAGVGLYRSEYLLTRTTIDRLTEDEQY